MNRNDEKPEKSHDEDSDEIMREHVYDGIQEYDKKLPNWWLMTFYGAIVFSIGYWFYFHIAEVGRTPEQRLAISQARAAAYAANAGGGGFSAERLIAMSLEDEVLERAKRSYATNCAACHGINAEGGIGPSLNDGEWLHGGMPMEVLASIRDGIPARGMPGWSSSLGSTGTAELTAFLLSLNPSPGNGAAPAAETAEESL